MNQYTIELAIQALEAEKVKITAAIAELKSGLSGRAVAPRKASGGREMSAPLAAPAKAVTGGRKRRITAAGRAALALAAKRRWAKAKAAGKSTL